ncbi:MAG: alpha/beta fold hydrolase [Pseudomonadales bacterium]|nr:alpha/beta fold hydrolase [Pseudomonadales bacterium]
MPIESVNGIDLYYEIGGTGEQVLFISGSGGDLRNKPNQFDSPLAESFEIICYDQRGLGQTANPDGPFTMAEYADDAAGLLDRLGVDRIPVIGVSFGGMVGQEFAIRHPDRVSALVLACTSSGGAGGASYPLHDIEDLADIDRAQTHLKVADVRHTGQWISENPKKWQRRVDMSVAARRGDRDPSGGRKQLEARRVHDTFARLSRIAVPTLLAGGEFDGVAPPENMRAIGSQIAASEVRFFNGGHMFLAQDKTAYKYIIQWLKGNI